MIVSRIFHYDDSVCRLDFQNEMSKAQDGPEKPTEVIFQKVRLGVIGSKEYENKINLKIVN